MTGSDAGEFPIDRRGFVGRIAGSAGITAAVAGCLGDGESGGRGGESGDGGDGGGGGGGERTLDTHPGAAEIAAQPHLGPDPGEATGVVVVFEDPSCHRCRAFERETVPKIRDNLVEPGEVTLAVRNYPVVFEWGKPACQALEATFAREVDAFWALRARYFEAQSEFDAENVLAKTRSFLDADTDVDADAVVADAEEKAHDEAVQADISAAEASDVGATPTVLLFREGTYRTKATGSIDYDVVESALGL